MFDDQIYRFHCVIHAKGPKVKLLRKIAATVVLHAYFFLMRFPSPSNWYFGNALSVLHKEKSQLKRAKSNHITIKVSRSVAYIYRVGISGNPAGVQQLYDRVRFCLLNRAGWSWSKEAGCVRTRGATGGTRARQSAWGARGVSRGPCGAPTPPRAPPGTCRYDAAHHRTSPTR